ncbi:MAG: helix-turn-helix domain-containing protein [Erythrobacter sp.]
MHSDFRPAPEHFNGCFTSIYYMSLDIQGGSDLVDYLQPEWANIRFFAGSAPHASIGANAVSGAGFVATGPSSLPCRFSLSSSRMWGVGFLPLGWARFFDAGASAHSNMVCDGAAHPAFARFASLSEVLCDPEADADEQCAAIIALLDRLMRPTRDDAKIQCLHEAIVNGQYLSVNDLAEACAMSVRTLERMCLRYFGFPPKLLIRRQRFMRSLTNFMLRGSSHWIEAMDGHYHDQAQFTREFNEFMTMNPSEYAALDHPILSSFMAARARIWGSAAQTLDPPLTRPKD